MLYFKSNENRIINKNLKIRGWGPQLIYFFVLFMNLTIPVDTTFQVS